MTIARTLAVMLVTGLAAVDASAKFIALDDRCRCASDWDDHGQYVRCIKRNAKRYIRFEARFAPQSERRRLTRSEVRAAACARVAEAMTSRCGMSEHLCELVARPCPAGETCDVRGCDATVGVCVPTPGSCPAGGESRCSCGSETDPFGRTYANDCERLRAGARVDTFGNLPYASCLLSCGGPDATECPAPFVCRYPDGTCGEFDEHGRCEDPQPGTLDPICGCDGKTYLGRDDAAQAGTRIAYPGLCGSQCGGPVDFQCLAGTWCLKEWSKCDVPHLWGSCRAITNETCLQLGPVCGM